MQTLLLFIIYDWLRISETTCIADDMAATLSINGYLQMCVRIMCFGLINCLYEHWLASIVTQLTMLTLRSHRKEAKHNLYINMLRGGGALKLNIFCFGGGCAMSPNELAWSWMWGNDPTLTLIGGGSRVVAKGRFLELGGGSLNLYWPADISGGCCLSEGCLCLIEATGKNWEEASVVAPGGEHALCLTGVCALCVFSLIPTATLLCQGGSALNVAFVQPELPVFGQTGFASLDAINIRFLLCKVSTINGGKGWHTNNSCAKMITATCTYMCICIYALLRIKK